MMLGCNLSGRCCSFMPFNEIAGGSESVVDRRPRDTSIITHIGEEHRALQRLLLRHKDKKLSASERDTIKREFMNAVHGHVTSATIVLQPAVRRYVIDCARWVKHIGQEQENIDRLLAAQRQNMNDDKLWKELKIAVKQHIKDEEQITLDWLHRRMPADQMLQLGADFLQVKRGHKRVNSGTFASPNIGPDSAPPPVPAPSDKPKLSRQSSYEEMFSDFEQTALKRLSSTSSMRSHSISSALSSMSDSEKEHSAAQVINSTA